MACDSAGLKEEASRVKEWGSQAGVDMDNVEHEAEVEVEVDNKQGKKSQETASNSSEETPTNTSKKMKNIKTNNNPNESVILHNTGVFAQIHRIIKTIHGDDVVC